MDTTVFVETFSNPLPCSRGPQAFLRGLQIFLRTPRSLSGTPNFSQALLRFLRASPDNSGAPRFPRSVSVSPLHSHVPVSTPISPSGTLTTSKTPKDLHCSLRDPQISLRTLSLFLSSSFKTLFSSPGPPRNPSHHPAAYLPQPTYLILSGSSLRGSGRECRSPHSRQVCVHGR